MKKELSPEKESHEFTFRNHEDKKSKESQLKEKSTNNIGNALK